jgi:hypothetical protein
MTPLGVDVVVPDELHESMLDPLMVVRLFGWQNAATARPTPQPAQRESDGMLMAWLGQRRQLVSELDGLNERRTQVTAELSQTKDRATANALRQQLASTERRISEAETALRGVNRAIANMSGEAAPAAAADEHAPAMDAVMPVPMIAGSESPGSVAMTTATYLGGGALILVLGVAIGYSIARRLRREAAESIRALRADLTERMSKLTVGMDSIAVEVERLGEGQRYVTKALADRQPVAAEARRRD